MGSLERAHEAYGYGRRIRRLATQLAAWLPREGRVLDIGCGDGRLTSRLAACRPDVYLEGVDVLARQACRVPVRVFDGMTIPAPDRSYDLALLVDVVHHAADPLRLLTEAVRVSRQGLLIKDHRCETPLDRALLAFMDRVGNARHGVALPFTYWSKAAWERAFAQAGLRVSVWQSDLRLYPWPVSLACDRSLHFIARLEPCGP
jgi:SAM-dependent methyltransferase